MKMGVHMRKITMIFCLFLAVLFTTTESVGAEENNDWEPTIVYIDDRWCVVCQEVKQKVIEPIIEAGDINVIIYDVEIDRQDVLAYWDTYGVRGQAIAPVVFAGDQFFYDKDDIVAAYEDGTLAEHAQYPLRDTSEWEPRNYTFFTALGVIIIGGLIDGVNPCAIAMLLMFISMVGTVKNRRVLAIVSFAYILGVFVVYFTFSLGVLTLLDAIRVRFTAAAVWLYLGFGILCTLLFLITLYDFFVTKKQEYGKIRNQLPKVLRNFNKRVMETFTNAIKKASEGKPSPMIIIVPFTLGVLIGMFEAVCTGQIAVGVLGWVDSLNPGGGVNPLEIFYVLVFNIMFIIPLVIIALLAIKYRSTMAVSNFVRERMSLIKFATSIFFLFLAVYFILMFMGVEFLQFSYNVF